MNKVAICVHDLRLSTGQHLINSISCVRGIFGERKVTFHIVVDIEINHANPTTIAYLKNQVSSGELEIVFHGIAHKTTPPGTWRWLRWYHHDEAEFISPTIDERTNTRRFNDLNSILSIQPVLPGQVPTPSSYSNPAGICPSCWIASKNGWRFIKNLRPKYRERLLCLKTTNDWFLSLPLSIATINTLERFFLSLIVRAGTYVTGTFNKARTRLVVHAVELCNPVSIQIFLNAYDKLMNKGFTPVLQRDLF